MKVLFISVLVSFFFFSCTENKNDSEKNNAAKISVKHIEYYSNGQRKFLSEEKQGVKDGIYYRWTKNGRIKTKGQFINGKRSGTWEWFDNRGVSCMKVCYKL